MKKRRERKRDREDQQRGEIARLASVLCMRDEAIREKRGKKYAKMYMYIEKSGDRKKKRNKAKSWARDESGMKAGGPQLAKVKARRRGSENSGSGCNPLLPAYIAERASREKTREAQVRSASEEKLRSRIGLVYVCG